MSACGTSLEESRILAIAVQSAENAATYSWAGSPYGFHGVVEQTMLVVS